MRVGLPPLQRQLLTDHPVRTLAETVCGFGARVLVTQFTSADAEPKTTVEGRDQSPRDFQGSTWAEVVVGWAFGVEIAECFVASFR